MKRWAYPSVILNIILLLIIIFLVFRQTTASLVGNTTEQVRNETRNQHFATFYSSPTDIVFVGDSLTDYFEWAEVYPSFNVKNRGLAGDTSAQVLARMDTVLLLQPDKIFLMVGVNDFKEEDMTPNDTAENIRSIIRAVKASPDEITLYVQSILPSTRDPEGIVLANSLIQEVCKEENVTYIDLYPLFAEPDNTIRPEMTYDNLHLSSFGYQAWIDALDIYILE